MKRIQMYPFYQKWYKKGGGVGAQGCKVDLL